MDIQTAGTVGGIAVAVVTVSGAVWYAARQVGKLVLVLNQLLAMVKEWPEVTTRLGKVELYVNTLWEFVMRRGTAEAVQKGVATVNSPVRLRAEAIEWMAALAIPLREAYEARWKDLDDIGLCVAIENEFGAQITLEVCIPHQVTNAACLLIACAVAKGETFVTGSAAI